MWPQDFMANRRGKLEAVTYFLFLGSKITVDGICNREIKRCLFPGKKALTNLDSVFKSRDITLLTKVHIVKGMVFPVVFHVLLWKLDHKEGWGPKNWCFLSVVLGKTLESPLDCKEIRPVNPKGSQPWIFIVRTLQKLILWSPDAKSQMIGKDPDAEGRRRSRQQRMRWLDSITDSMDMNVRKLQ